MGHGYSAKNLLASNNHSWAGETTSPSYSGGARNHVDGRMDRLTSVTNASNTFAVIDLAAAAAANCFAFLNCNLATLAGTQFTLYGADDAGITVNVVTAKAASDIYAQGFASPKGKDIVFAFPTVTKRYWKPVISWTGTPTGTFGEVWMGAAVGLTRPLPFGNSGAGLEHVNQTSRAEATGDVRQRLLSGPYHTRAAEWLDVNATELLELETMWRATSGGKRPFLWIESYNAVQTAAAAADMDCICGHLGPDTWDWAEMDEGRFRPSPFTVRGLTRGVGL